MRPATPCRSRRQVGSSSTIVPRRSRVSSAIDFDSTAPGIQTVPSSTGIINIDAGDGDDIIALGDGVDLRGHDQRRRRHRHARLQRRSDSGPGQPGTRRLRFSSATLGGDQESSGDHPCRHRSRRPSATTTRRRGRSTIDVDGVRLSAWRRDRLSHSSGTHRRQRPDHRQLPRSATRARPAGTGFTFFASGLILPAAARRRSWAAAPT